MSAGARLWSMLGSRWAGAFVVASGLALTAGSVFNGICIDDRFLRALSQGYAPIERPPWDLFHFIPGDPAEKARLLDRGVLPWFTGADNRASFFRPLSSLSTWADYRLLPDLPWLFHLENLALYGGLIAVVLALYRALLPDPRLAALAGLLFAIDDAHGMTAGWLANRSALLAALFGVGALWLHHRAARGWRPGLLLAPVAFALSLCAGELGLGALGFLVAYAVALDERPARWRLGSLAPTLVVFLAWVAARHVLGSGVRGSGFYIDPLDAPLRFLAAFPARLLALSVGQLALPASDYFPLWLALPWPARLAAAGVGVALLALVVRVTTPTVRASPVARFFGLGLVLALIPGTAVLPADRNLLLAGVGGCGLVAQVLGGLGSAAPTAAGAVERWGRRLLIAAHLVVAPLVLPLTALSPGLVDWFARSTLMPILSDESIRGQTLVQVNMTTMVLNAFYVATPAARGDPVPARVRTLAMTDDPITVTREDPRTLRIVMEPGYFIEPTSAVVRVTTDAWRVGEAVELPGTRITVLQVDERGAPLELRFQFDVPLEDPSLRWVSWNGRALVPFEPPRPGASVRVAH